MNLLLPEISCPSEEKGNREMFALHILKPSAVFLFFFHAQHFQLTKRQPYAFIPAAQFLKNASNKQDKSVNKK